MTHVNISLGTLSSPRTKPTIPVLHLDPIVLPAGFRFLSSRPSLPLLCFCQSPMWREILARDAALSRRGAIMAQSSFRPYVHPPIRLFHPGLSIFSSHFILSSSPKLTALLRRTLPLEWNATIYCTCTVTKNADLRWRRHGNGAELPRIVSWQAALAATIARRCERVQRPFFFSVQQLPFLSLPRIKEWS